MSLATLLVAVSLGLDLFAGGLAVGIAGLPRDRWPKTALIFAFFGIVLLALGLLLGRLLSDSLGNVASYLAGAALIILGLRSLYGITRSHADDAPEEIDLDPKSVMTTGFVASLDKVAVGISLAVVELSTGPVLIYFFIQGFILTFLGLSLGKRLGSRLGFVAHLLAGAVFIILGVIIIVQTARNRAIP